MKDYRLSEIVAHCKEMHNRYGEKACDNCNGARFCENQFANIPQYWTDEHDIEPRDMIELPSVNCIYNPIVGEVIYQVIYRNDMGFIRGDNFGTEPEADDFLARLKGGKE